MFTDMVTEGSLLKISGEVHGSLVQLPNIKVHMVV